VIKRFQGPDNFGDNQQSGDELNLTFGRLPKKSLGSFGFNGIIVRQKTQEDICVYKKLSHERPLFAQGFF
jgi:hypothetical protein